MNNLLQSYSVLGIILILGAIIFFSGVQSLRTTSFNSNSVKTVGTITDISSQNQSCQRTSREAPWDCTVFGVEISYNTPQGLVSIWRSAGRVKGHNMGYEYADYKLGDTIPIVYDSRDPDITERTISIEWTGVLLKILIVVVIILGPGLLTVGTIDAIYKTIKSGGFLGKAVDILVTIGLSIVLGIIFFVRGLLFWDIWGFKKLTKGNI